MVTSGVSSLDLHQQAGQDQGHHPKSFLQDMLELDNLLQTIIPSTSSAFLCSFLPLVSNSSCERFLDRGVEFSSGILGSILMPTRFQGKGAAI